MTRRYDKVVPKAHEEWLAEREKGIGSSEVGTILGVNKFDTPYKLWRRKTKLDPPVDETLIMKLGHLMEDAVATLYAEETGATIVKSTKGDWIAVDKERPWLRVSPDRLYVAKGDKKTENNYRVLECKTTRLSVDPDNINTIPKYWWCQIQYQMYVLGIEHGALAWVKNGTEFGYMEVDRSDDFCIYMVERLDSFWNDNILGGQEPPSLNVDDVVVRYPVCSDSIMNVTLDSEVYKAWAELKDVKKEYTKYETRKKELEDIIKVAMGEYQGVMLEEEGFEPYMLATWKNPSKPTISFDKKAFEKEYPELYKQFCKESLGSRRFLFKDI